MIVLALLLVLALLPVLVLHDVNAGGLYCTHTAVSGGVSTWGVTLFVNTTSLNPFSVLARYSCTSLPQIIYARHLLYILYPHLDCDCVSPLAGSRGRVAVTCVKSTIQARVLGARRQGHPWVAHRGRDFALWNTFETMTPGNQRDTTELDIVKGNLTLWNFRETMKPRRHRDTLHIEQMLLLLKSL